MLVEPVDTGLASVPILVKKPYGNVSTTIGRLSRNMVFRGSRKRLCELCHPWAELVELNQGSRDDRNVQSQVRQIVIWTQVLAGVPQLGTMRAHVLAYMEDDLLEIVPCEFDTSRFNYCQDFRPGRGRSTKTSCFCLLTDVVHRKPFLLFEHVSRYA
jgi:hypothetical protein